MTMTFGFIDLLYLFGTMDKVAFFVGLPIGTWAQDRSLSSGTNAL